VNRFSSIMNQLLQFFSRTQFQKRVEETKSERHCRGFHSWTHFVAMVFCHLADAQSLREITGGLASCQGRLEQLGMTVPKRSTLCYANKHRPWELFQSVFYDCLERCRMEIGHRTKFRFKNRLLSIDSTVVTLCLEMFPGATYSRQKGAVKLHFTLDHAGYLPEAMVITTGVHSELTVAKRRHYGRGTILIMDRGFIDFGWFGQLNQQGVLFVTRVKSDSRYEVVECRDVVPGKGILSDRLIRLTSKTSSENYPDPLRLVLLRTEEGEELEFLTNHLSLAASTIGNIYKDRWQIETFFKLLKQNLHVKSFVGTSGNAVWIQIWTALIAMLLIRFLQLKARFGWSFSNLIYFLRMNLFVYRDLWEWLNEPFVRSPEPSPTPQLDLGWS
jgi:hypothetical protein